MKKNHSSPPPSVKRRAAAIQMGSDQLELVLIEETATERIIHVDQTQWRKGCSVYSKEAGEQLAAALTQLQLKWQLKRTPITLSLSGDFCVTRVATGSKDEVDRELEESERRSALYISLGLGQKVMAKSFRRTNSQQVHGLAAVVNSSLLELLAMAATASRVKFSRVEPAAVGLCRLVGFQGVDRDAPALIVNISERWTEICISQAGHLYLSYRPAALQDHTETASLVSHHHARLKRYCRRRSLPGNGELPTALLSGESAAVDTVRAALAAAGVITAEPLALDAPLAVGSEDLAWRCDMGELSSSLAPGIGACLSLLAGADDYLSAPDLLPEVRQREREPWQRRLIRFCGPIAALVLLFAANRAAVQYQTGIVQQLELENAPVLAIQEQLDGSREHLIDLRDRLGYLNTVDQRTADPDLRGLVEQITRCLSESMTLDTIHVHSDGKIQLDGRSGDEPAVYDFVAWLRRLPGITSVALNGTTPQEVRGVPTTGFEIECQARQIFRQQEPLHESA